MTRGYCPGVFDMFHIGHLRIFQRARQHCGVLIAGVVTDEVAEQAKGRRPIIPFEERFEIVQNLAIVDEVIADDTVRKDEMWERVRYDILFKGDDWKGTPKGDALEAKLAERDVSVHYFPYSQTTSSSRLRKLVGDD